MAKAAKKDDKKKPVKKDDKKKMDEKMEKGKKPFPFRPFGKK